MPKAECGRRNAEETSLGRTLSQNRPSAPHIRHSAFGIERPTMIVRDDGSSYVLITQPDHARLAAEIVAAMRTEPALTGANREVVLVATREHDNGWREVDAQPTITGSGRPCDFIEGPAPIKHALWPRGIARAALVNARAGALVAEHALTVYAYRRSEA